MNCPYCDETVHGMAKFCPKCGLPLKEDATVMGAYVGDGDGPNWTMIGSGAAVLAVIALLAGWLGSRGDSAVPQTPAGPSGWASGSVGYSAPTSYQYGAATYNPGSGHSMTDDKPHWVWTPPQQLQMGPSDASYAELPPGQFLAMNPVVLSHVPQPTYAYIAPSTSPAVPALPGDIPPLTPMSENLSGYVLDNNPPSPPAEDPTGNYVYDPAQERYTLKAERLHSTGYSSGNTVGGTIPVRGYRPGNVPGYGPGYGNAPVQNYPPGTAPIGAGLPGSPSAAGQPAPSAPASSSPFGSP